ncbi:MAG: hypothetical protein GC147_06930 [Porphyrobacter sp.]|nr:hypothetical protein [Porphyrobacter sp.]
MHPLLLQFGGSLVAILALAGLAYWLKLGGMPRLDSDEAVRRVADEIADGFVPTAIARDAEGRAALARDAAGRIMLIKRHGNRFAGRLLGPGARTRSAAEMLEVDCGEPRFGRVALMLDEPRAWAAAIDGLNGAGHA